MEHSKSRQFLVSSMQHSGSDIIFDMVLTWFIERWIWANSLEADENVFFFAHLLSLLGSLMNKIL